MSDVRLRTVSRYLSGSLIAFVVAIVFSSSGCDRESDGTGTGQSSATVGRPVDRFEIPVDTSRDAVATIHFENVAADSGIVFQWSGGPTDRSCMPEQNGGGVAIHDFDRDGIPDLALTDCGTFDGSGPSSVQAVHLCRGLGGLQFETVSMHARLGSEASAAGVAAGDFDGDGFADLFVAAFGRNLLLRNCGDGTFEDVTNRSGITGDSWSTSVAFADLNSDGYLDVYVVNYVDWTRNAEVCRNPQHPELAQICSPNLFNAQFDQLLLSTGDGTFEDASANSGIVAVKAGNGLALEIADFTGDGLLDVFVANDVGMNNLFRNEGGGRFVESGVSAGVAVSSDGALGASMGTACADYNRDGELDLVVTNFRGQVNDLYSGIGGGGFVHANGTVGLDVLSRHRLAFGAVFGDFDLDGWPDLFVANGHIWNVNAIDPNLEYEMSCDILRNVGGRLFQDASATAGPWFSEKFLARAVGAGDLNNDGATDLVVQNVGSPLAILKNTCHQSGAGRTLRFIGTVACREPLGCRVEVKLSDQKTLVTHVPSGGSFQASHDPRLIVPVLDATIEQILIAWPDGTAEYWIGPFPSGEIVLLQGTGQSNG